MNDLRKGLWPGSATAINELESVGRRKTSLSANDLHPSPQGDSKKVINDWQSLIKRWTKTPHA
jgi:hypothetical protein